MATIEYPIHVDGMEVVKKAVENLILDIEPEKDVSQDFVDGFKYLANAIVTTLDNYGKEYQDKELIEKIDDMLYMRFGDIDNLVARSKNGDFVRVESIVDMIKKIIQEK
jgi:lantibiotic modifying enzyme